jgi:hypothetical protein
MRLLRKLDTRGRGLRNKVVSFKQSPAQSSTNDAEPEVPLQEGQYELWEALQVVLGSPAL